MKVRVKNKKCKCDVCTAKGLIEYQKKELASQNESLEEADRIIARLRGTIEELTDELYEANDRANQLERAVRNQSACWMCANNQLCHQGEDVPQSPDVACGKFKFGYLKSTKHLNPQCEYLHGKVCWGQKGTPLCTPEFCPIKERKERSEKHETIDFLAGSRS